MDIHRQASELKALLDNPFFMDAIDQVREDLINQEDAIITEGGLEPEKVYFEVQKLALSRVLLTAIVNKLEMVIMDSHNQQEGD